MVSSRNTRCRRKSLVEARISSMTKRKSMIKKTKTRKRMKICRILMMRWLRNSTAVVR